MSTRKKDYKVGYKRPPTVSRFQPGQSGNPAGRPKGSKKFPTMLREIANRKVSIAGSSQKISLGEAVLRKLFASAVSGDPKAQAMVISLMEVHLPGEVNAGADPQLCANERSILAQLLSEGGDDGSV